MATYVRFVRDAIALLPQRCDYFQVSEQSITLRRPCGEYHAVGDVILLALSH